MKTSPFDQIMRLEHLVHLCDFKDYPHEVKSTLKRICH